MTDFSLDMRIHDPCDLTYQDLPACVIARVQSILTDTLAVTAFGAATPVLRRMVHAAPLHGPAATFMPALPGTSMEWASLLNVAAAVWNELDEGLRGAGHPAAHAVTAALAVAQHAEATGPDFLSAVVAGYKLPATIGRELSLHGPVHPQSSFGAPGAALAAAVVLGLSHQQRRTSVNIAASMAPASLWQACTEGADIRHFCADSGARAGVTAALLAGAGVEAPTDAVKLAYCNVLGTSYEEPRRAWAILDGYVKRWPSCAFTHTTLDAAERLRPRRGTGDWTVGRTAAPPDSLGHQLLHPRPARDSPRRGPHPLEPRSPAGDVPRASHSEGHAPGQRQRTDQPLAASHAIARPDHAAERTNSTRETSRSMAARRLAGNLVIHKFPSAQRRRAHGADSPIHQKYPDRHQCPSGMERNVPRDHSLRTEPS